MGAGLGYMLEGLGDCVLGQPSTDPACFTSSSYTRALNLAQDTQEVKANLLPGGIDDAACYDAYMQPGPGFNADEYNRCIGARDVVSPQASVAAASNVPFTQNPFIFVPQGQTAQVSTVAPVNTSTGTSQPGRVQSAPVVTNSNSVAALAAQALSAQAQAVGAGTTTGTGLSMSSLLLLGGAVLAAWALFGRK